VDPDVGILATVAAGVELCTGATTADVVGATEVVITGWNTGDEDLELCTRGTTAAVVAATEVGGTEVDAGGGGGT